MSDPKQDMQSLEAEQAVLGAMLIDSDCIRDVLTRLRETDFVLMINGQIFRTIRELESGDKIIDAMVGANAMHADNELREYLAQLIEITPTSANVLEYADMVLSASRRRALRAAVQEAAEKLDANVPELEILPDLERTIDNTAERMGSNLLTPMQQVERYYAHRAMIDSGKSPYVRTGFQLIDRLLGGGMLYSGLYFLAARPGMGKTTLSLNLAEYAAQDMDILFVSLEMNDEQLTAKRISTLERLDYQTVLNGGLTEKQYEQVADAANRISKSRLYTNSCTGANVRKICDMARSRKGVRLVIIDHFSLIQVPGRRSRYEEYTAVSAELKRLARSINGVVLCLAQLNRSNEQRADKRPMMSDLRDTGAAEQDADGIFFLHRPGYYDGSEKEGQPSYTEFTVAKNRHGRTGTIPLNFYPKTSIFKEKFCK